MESFQFCAVLAAGVRYFRILFVFQFPAMFAGLNVIYWSYYLAKADMANSDK